MEKQMIQNINNIGSVVKEQIILGNIDNLNIDDLFKDNTNNKKMKNNNYPNWLVPLDIAQQLKEIGFDEPTLFHYYENDFDVSVETIDYYNEGEAQGYLNFYISALKEEDFNIYSYYISIPTFEQVFKWFREQGLVGIMEFEDFNLDEITCYYAYLITKSSGEILFYSPNYRTYEIYEEAREALVKALIRTYKSEQL
ncbi:hypothetical protein [Capnocytophaga leadbetteri]|uniref:hypothetical protein n=1 Tax=Capnocytophaga leadbetteri TaxID=327575 RepID=UPI0028E749E5|nr:hypothetical protein [Capnocytophaga leadbetteri]